MCPHLVWLPSVFLDSHLTLTSSTTKNPNVSQEAKDSAAERLKEMGQ